MVLPYINMNLPRVMAAITICRDFGAQKDQVWHCFRKKKKKKKKVKSDLPTGWFSRIIWLICYSSKDTVQSLKFEFILSYFLLIREHCLLRAGLCFTLERRKSVIESPQNTCTPVCEDFSLLFLFHFCLSSFLLSFWNLSKIIAQRC